MVYLLVILAGLQSMIAFGALLWSLPKSNHAFFLVFVGDALLRLVVLGAVTYWLWDQKLSFTAPLLTLAFSYLALSLTQIPFFHRLR